MHVEVATEESRVESRQGQANTKSRHHGASGRAQAGRRRSAVQKVKNLDGLNSFNILVAKNSKRSIHVVEPLVDFVRGGAARLVADFNDEVTLSLSYQYSTLEKNLVSF